MKNYFMNNISVCSPAPFPTQQDKSAFIFQNVNVYF